MENRKIPPAPITRCKFRVDSVELDGWGEKVKAAPVMGRDGVPENERFHEATPTGKLEMYITNKVMHGLFRPGQEFYLDITPATS